MFFSSYIYFNMSNKKYHTIQFACIHYCLILSILFVFTLNIERNWRKTINPLPDSVHSKSHTRLSTLILSVQLNLYSKQWHSIRLRLFKWFMAQTRSLWQFNSQNTKKNKHLLVLKKSKMWRFFIQIWCYNTIFTCHMHIISLIIKCIVFSIVF